MTPFDIAIAIAVDLATRQLHTMPPPPPPAPLVVVYEEPAPTPPSAPVVAPTAVQPPADIWWPECETAADPACDISLNPDLTPPPPSTPDYEPGEFMYYLCTDPDNGLTGGYGVGSWVRAFPPPQDPWIAYRDNPNCVGVEGYENPDYEG